VCELNFIIFSLNFSLTPSHAHSSTNTKMFLISPRISFEQIALKMMFLFYILFILIILTFVYFRRFYSYWEDRGFPSIPARFPLGSFGLLGNKEHPSDYFRRHHEHFKHKGPAIGLYFLNQTQLAITDPELVKDVLTRNFDHFHERFMHINEKDDPLMANLFALGGQEWKNIRVKLTPTFTSGKMKMMFPLVSSSADRMINYLKPFAEKNEPLELKEVFSSFTIEVIASVAFGLEIECLGKSENKFKEIANSIFNPKFFDMLRAIFIYVYPKLAMFFSMSFTPKKSADFFMGMIRDTMEYREKNNFERNDFIQLLINLKKNEELTFNEIAANSFIFFFAG
jgi:cytochrome P450 family 6